MSFMYVNKADFVSEESLPIGNEMRKEFVIVEVPEDGNLKTLTDPEALFSAVNKNLFQLCEMQDQIVGLVAGVEGKIGELKGEKESRDRVDAVDRKNRWLAWLGYFRG